MALGRRSLDRRGGVGRRSLMPSVLKKNIAHRHATWSRVHDRGTVTTATSRPWLSNMPQGPRRSCCVRGSPSSTRVSDRATSSTPFRHAARSSRARGGPLTLTLVTRHGRVPGRGGIAPALSNMPQATEGHTRRGRVHGRRPRPALANMPQRTLVGARVMLQLLKKILETWPRDAPSTALQHAAKRSPCAWAEGHRRCTSAASLQHVARPSEVRGDPLMLTLVMRVLVEGSSPGALQHAARWALVDARVMLQLLKKTLRHGREPRPRRIDRTFPTCRKVGRWCGVESSRHATRSGAGRGGHRPAPSNMPQTADEGAGHTPRREHVRRSVDALAPDARSRACQHAATLPRHDRGSRLLHWRTMVLGPVPAMNEQGKRVPGSFP